MSKRHSRVEISDELVGDYLDGRLDPEQEAELRAAIKADPQVAARVVAYQAQDSGLKQLADSVLNEPVPERLRRILEGPMKGSKNTLNAYLASAIMLGTAVALAATTLDAKPTGELSEREAESAPPVAGPAET